MESFFAELKRRHIYRVGAAYVVVAWAITQVIDVLSQIFDLPGSISRPAVIVLAVGFPVALIAAWMIESKPHAAVASAVRAKPTIVDWTLCGALGIVMLLIGFEQSAPSAEGTRQAGVEAAKQAAESPATAVSIAVLPFANLSGDASQEFFSDGITEEITGALTKVPDLRVVARTSAFEFKGQNRNIQTIGHQLQATHLIEGSVRKAGERVRITAQLINAANGTHIWSENYDRELTDIFAIQEDIARAIAASLRMSLGLRPGEQLVSNRAIDPESYQQFLRGKAALLRARTAYLDQLALLEPVVQKNPNYAPAWAAVARAYRSGAQFGRYSTPEESRRMRESYEQQMTAAARRAVELDPTFVDGQVMLARIQSGPRRLILAEDILKAALANDPNHPDGLDYYSNLLVVVGRIKEGVTIKQQVHQLEPYAPLYSGNLAQALWQDGQTDAAIALWKENWDAEGAGAGPGLARIYASLGRYADAARVGDEALLQPRNERFRSLITDYTRLMRTAPMKAAQPEKLPRLSDLSFVYLYIGAPERALEPFEEGFLTFNDIGLLFHSSYAPVRNTLRFKKIIRDAGLVDYWRARGWPDLCRPIGADDFECE